MQDYTSGIYKTMSVPLPEWHKMQRGKGVGGGIGDVLNGLFASLLGRQGKPAVANDTAVVSPAGMPNQFANHAANKAASSGMAAPTGGGLLSGLDGNEIMARLADMASGWGQGANANQSIALGNAAMAEGKRLRRGERQTKQEENRTRMLAVKLRIDPIVAELAPIPVLLDLITDATKSKQPEKADVSVVDGVLVDNKTGKPLYKGEHKPDAAQLRWEYEQKKEDDELVALRDAAVEMGLPIEQAIKLNRTMLEEWIKFQREVQNKGPEKADVSIVNGVLVDNKTGRPLYEGKPDPDAGLNREKWEAEKKKTESEQRAALDELAALRDAAIERGMPVEQALNMNKSMLEEWFKSQFEAPDNPASYREWELAVQAGDTRDYPQFLRETKNPQPDKFTEKTDEGLAKMFTDIVTEGQKANEMIGSLGQLKEIAKTVDFGKDAEIKQAIGPWLEMFGIKVDRLSGIQAFTSMAARLAPALRIPGVGAMSDFELQNFLLSLPQIGNTDEGNEIISTTIQQIAEYRRAASDIAARALSGKIDRHEAVEMLNGLPNPLALWKKKYGNTNFRIAPPSMEEGAPSMVGDIGAGLSSPKSPDFQLTPSGFKFRVLK